MLKKIFGNKKKHNNLAFNPFQSRGSGKSPDPLKKAVKIIHPGGHAEYHYMAIPASKVIEKYPSFVLTRPEFFRRPWDTIIRPDETLVPGQKYYVVPRQTVKKLRRRIKRTGRINNGLIKPGFSVEPNSFDSLSLSASKSGILVKPGPKSRTRNLHVRFFGINDTTNKKTDPPGLVSSVPYSDKKKTETGLKNGHVDEKKRRIRNENGWEPSLDAINEAW